MSSVVVLMGRVISSPPIEGPCSIPVTPLPCTNSTTAPKSAGWTAAPVDVGPAWAAQATKEIPQHTQRGRLLAAPTVTFVAPGSAGRFGPRTTKAQGAGN